MNQLYQFIQDNLQILIPMLLAIFALIGFIVSKKKQQIYAIIPTLINDAELLAASNPEKFAFVLDKTYNILPWYFKLFISKIQVSFAIQYIFSKIKGYAKQQAALVELTKIIVTDAKTQDLQQLHGSSQAATVKETTMPDNIPTYGSSQE